MPSKQNLSAEELEQYQTQLRSMRDRMSGEVDQVVEAVRSELDTSSNLSSVPVHMGDVAPSQLDANIDVIEAERGMLQSIQAALHRIDEGTFGQCTQCGTPIAPQRLQAIPYTPYCIGCASERSEPSSREIRS